MFSEQCLLYQKFATLLIIPNLGIRSIFAKIRLQSQNFSLKCRAKSSFLSQNLHTTNHPTLAHILVRSDSEVPPPHLIWESSPLMLDIRVHHLPKISPLISSTCLYVDFDWLGISVSNLSKIHNILCCLGKVFGRRTKRDHLYLRHSTL